MFQKIKRKHPEYFDTNGVNYYNEYRDLIKVKTEFQNKVNKYFIKEKTTFKTKEEKDFYDILIKGVYPKCLSESCNFFVLKNANNNQIKEIIDEMIGKCIILEYEEDLIILYEDIDVLPFHFQQVLSSDFYINCGIFEGGYFKVSDIFYIYCMQRYFLNNKLISNICDLVIQVFERDHHEMEMMKKVILKDMLLDSQLERIIYAFFDNNLNATKTAQSVFMHRNTINNKLDYIKKLTSIDLTSFVGSMAMFILLKMK